MKKRILSILLLCCMVLTLLPTTAFAAGELPDVKLSVPTTFDKTVDLTKQNGELKIKDSKTYLIKGSTDPNWYFQYRIKIDGKNNTPHKKMALLPRSARWMIAATRSAMWKTKHARPSLRSKACKPSCKSWSAVCKWRRRSKKA